MIPSFNLHQFDKLSLNQYDSFVKDKIAEGYDINARLNTKNETLLHKAVKAGNIYLTAVLLNNGADPKIENKKGKTPYNLITENGKTKKLWEKSAEKHSKKIKDTFSNLESKNFLSNPEISFEELKNKIIEKLNTRVTGLKRSTPLQTKNNTNQ